MDRERHPNESFDKWKGLLKTGLGVAGSVGLSEDTTVDLAQRLGDFLAEYIDPMNHEQRMLKEMWDVGDDHDRRVLAKLVTRVVAEERPGSDSYPGQPS